MNQAELAKHLASDRYPEAECAKRIKANEAMPAAEYLRATAPDAARELAIELLERGAFETQRRVLSRQGSGLLAVPFGTYSALLEAGGDKKLARPLVEWLELGRDEHLDALRAHFSGTDLRKRGRALPLNPAFTPRVWALIEPSLGDTLAAQAVEILQRGDWTFVTTAAFHLARKNGIELSSLGANFRQGGRSDVLPHAIKPMLELIWRNHEDDLFELLAGLPKRAGMIAWQAPWMLDFLEPETKMVESGDERTVVFRAQRVVGAASGKFAKKGRLSLKVHKTEAAAKKDFEKKLVAAEAKLGARSDWDGLAAVAVRKAFAVDPVEGLLAAASQSRLDDLEGLLARGADPNGAVTEARGHTRTALASAGAPGVVQRLLEAGADAGLEDALFTQMSRGDSCADWPYLLQESCIQLVRAGADLSATRNGRTPLHVAASFGWLDLIDALLEAGADRSTKTGPEAKVPGQTALEIAEAEGRHLAALRLRS